MVLASLAACDLPADTAGTLDRVRDGTLRVGLSRNPPWVEVADGAARGIEAELLEGFARTLNARVVWTEGSEAALVDALEQRSLDLAIAGFASDSPWGDRVGFTQPYASARAPASGRREDHVIAVMPGENALALALDRYLQESRPAVIAALAARNGR